MKTTIKHLLAAMVLLLVSTLSQSATTNHYDFSVNDIYYKIITEKHEVEAVEKSYTRGSMMYTTRYTGTLNIPAHVVNDGIEYKVKSVYLHASDRLESLILPEGLESINIKDCEGLTKLTIPNSVKEIKSLRGCTGISSLTIPESVSSISNAALSGNVGELIIYCDIPAGKTNLWGETYSFLFLDSKYTSIKVGSKMIGEKAFYGCSTIESIDILSSLIKIGSDAFANCSNLLNVNVESIEKLCSIEFSNAAANPLSYAKHLYINNKEIKDVILPNTIKSINPYVFSGWKELTSITIPESVTEIGEGAFTGCKGLTTFSFPNSITCISNSVFEGCTGLTSVAIPSSIISIGNRAFSGCSGLISITIPEGVTSIGGSAFNNCSGLTSFIISEGVTTIGSSAFSGCSGELIVNCNIPDSKNDYYSPFYNSKFTSVTINGSMIGNYAFYGCSTITSIELGNYVTSIGDAAFYGCTGLTSINIPNSVTSIGAYAFRGCTGLISINIPNSVTTIGAYAFMWCSGLTSITIPSSVTNIGAGAFFCSSITSPIYIDKLFVYLPASYEGEYIIPETIETICDCAFSGCSGLTSVNIPESVTSIGESVFQNCSGLTSINIPNSVTSIGVKAFISCSSLTSINIPESVTSIGNGAFQYCSSLTSINFLSSVMKIGSYAFSDCSNIKTVYSQGITPPTIVNDTFDNTTYTSAFLYIPTGCEEAYGTAEGWKNFSKIREKDFGIKDCLLALKGISGGIVSMKYKTMAQYSFLITADEGWKVSSVSFNGSDVTSELAQDGSYTTPALTGDSELNVVFEQDGNEVKEVGEDGQLRVFASGSAVTIQNNGEPQQVSIYTTDGKAVKQTIAERGNTRITLKEGNVYLLKIGERTFKVAM